MSPGDQWLPACSCGNPTQHAPSDLAAILAAALHDALDGDFLVSAGMRHGNTGVDVAISKAAPKEVVHWAANVCAQVIADTYLPAVVREAEARAWDEGWYVRCHTLSAKNPYSGRKVDQYVGPERSYRNKGDGSEGQ